MQVHATQRVERLGESQDAVSADERGGKDPSKTTAKIRTSSFTAACNATPLYDKQKEKKILSIFPSSMNYKGFGCP